jgi:alkyl sulfatase BDS1-like metallo-beta-lactamase superfamily hydrolase
MSRSFATAPLFSLLGLLACGDAPTPAAPVDTEGALAAHSAEFERGVIEVTDGVHVAVGFALANSIMLEGDDGIVVVDTTESLETGRQVREAFRAITPKPVRAIVYTHNHTDHVFGSPAFADAGEPAPAVYAHATTEAYIDRIVNVIRPAIYRRSMRMFGALLPQQLKLNAGIGPFLATGGHGGGTLGLLRPTHTFQDTLDVEVAGVRLQLVHAPGETNDQLFVWLPERDTLLPGDNFYRAFPNLYTIRGTLYRDVLDWVDSLDAMRALAPEHLVPSHTRPLSGAAHIDAQLTAYRDAIQYVHDQTIRGINRGLTPDQLVEAVVLPPHLATNPWLQEFYGTVEWSVRAIFTGYLGWFDGNAAHLSPLPPAQRAERMAALAGEGTSLASAAAAALDVGDLRWAAELADLHLTLEPADAVTRATLSAALRGLGEAHPSANGRNYYLSQALEATRELEIGEPAPDSFPAELIHSFPLAGIMRSMTVNLDAAASADVDQVVGFRFPDVGEEWMLHVRRGVAELQPRFPAAPDIAVTVNSDVWKDLLTGRRNAALTLASDDVDVEGGAFGLIRFLQLFTGGG